MWRQHFAVSNKKNPDKCCQYARNSMQYTFCFVVARNSALSIIKAKCTEFCALGTENGLNRLATQLLTDLLSSNDNDDRNRLLLSSSSFELRRSVKSCVANLLSPFRCRLTDDILHYY